MSKHNIVNIKKDENIISFHITGFMRNLIKSLGLLKLKLYYFDVSTRPIQFENEVLSRLKIASREIEGSCPYHADSEVNRQP